MTIDQSQIQKALDASKIAEYKQFVQLLQKLDQGKSLTATEQSQFRRLQENLEDILYADKISLDPGEIILNDKGIAAFFGVKDRQVRNWKQLGCPAMGKNRYPLKQVHEWWLENVYLSHRDTPAIISGKEEYWLFKGKNERVDYEKKREQLIERVDVARGWSHRVLELTKGLDQLATRLSHLLVGIADEARIHQIIDTEQRKMRENFIRTGRWIGEDERPKKRGPDRLRKSKIEISEDLGVQKRSERQRKK